MSFVVMYGFSLTLDSPFVNDLAHVSLDFLWCEASALNSTGFWVELQLVSDGGLHRDYHQLIFTGARKADGL